MIRKLNYSVQKYVYKLVEEDRKRREGTGD